MLIQHPIRKRVISNKGAQLLTGNEKQQQQETKFTIVSSDEFFLFYDSLVRRVWIDKEKRLVVLITGSHKYSCIFGTINMEE